MPRPKSIEEGDEVEQTFIPSGALPDTPTYSRRGRVLKVEKTTARVRFDNGREERVALARLRVLHPEEPPAPVVVERKRPHAWQGAVAGAVPDVRPAQVEEEAAVEAAVEVEDFANDVRALREMARGLEAKAQRAVMEARANVEMIEASLAAAKAALKQAEADAEYVRAMSANASR